MVQDRQDRNGQTDKRATTKNSRSSLKVLKNESGANKRFEFFPRTKMASASINQRLSYDIPSTRI